MAPRSATARSKAEQDMLDKILMSSVVEILLRDKDDLDQELENDCFDDLQSILAKIHERIRKFDEKKAKDMLNFGWLVERGIASHQCMRKLEEEVSKVVCPWAAIIPTPDTFNVRPPIHSIPRGGPGARNVRFQEFYRGEGPLFESPPDGAHEPEDSDGDESNSGDDAPQSSRNARSRKRRASGGHNTRSDKRQAVEPESSVDLSLVDKSILRDQVEEGEFVFCIKGVVDDKQFYILRCTHSDCPERVSLKHPFKKFSAVRHFGKHHGECLTEVELFHKYAVLGKCHRENTRSI